MTDNDDRQIGRLLSRREFLALMAVLGAGYLAACTRIEDGAIPAASNTPPGTGLPAETVTEAVLNPAAGATVEPTPSMLPATQTGQAAVVPSCVVRPELTEGPFFFDTQLNRSDIRGEPGDGAVKEGVPLSLTFHVSQVAEDRCLPLAGAVVDVWHCDALGAYSGVGETSEMSFLRGYQVTDDSGSARFTTIYPGWYPGRAVHIHFKVRTGVGEGQMYDFTSQLFFDEALSEQVYAREPYSSKGLGYPQNLEDGIFRSGGDQLLLDLTPEGDGFRANFNLGLDLS